MIEVKCPRCKSEIEIDEYKNEEENKIAIFCSNKKCIYYKNPLIGINRKNNEVYITEAFL